MSPVTRPRHTGGPRGENWPPQKLDAVGGTARALPQQSRPVECSSQYCELHEQQQGGV